MVSKLLAYSISLVFKFSDLAPGWETFQTGACVLVSGSIAPLCALALPHILPLQEVLGSSGTYPAPNLEAVINQNPSFH